MDTVYISLCVYLRTFNSLFSFIFNSSIRFVAVKLATNVTFYLKYLNIKKLYLVKNSVSEVQNTPENNGVLTNDINYTNSDLCWVNYYFCPTYLIFCILSESKISSFIYHGRASVDFQPYFTLFKTPYAVIFRK